MKKHRVYALLLVFAVFIAAITIIGAQLIGQIMPFDSSDLPAYQYDCKMLIDAILLGINILSDTLLFICGVKISQRDK